MPPRVRLCVRSPLAAVALAFYAAFTAFTTCPARAASEFKIGPDVNLDSLALAAGNAQYLAVWRDLRNGNAAPLLRGATVGSTGVVSADFQIADAAGVPAKARVQRQNLAFDGTNYLVVWQDARSVGAGLRGALVNASGAVIGGADFLIATLNRTQDADPLVAFNGADYVVAWQDTPLAGSGTQISFCRVTTAGVAAGNASIPASFSAVSQSLEFLLRGPGSEVLLLYQDASASPTATRATRIDGAGAFIGAGEGTLLFNNDFSTTGFGAPIGAAFDGTEYHILSSHGAQIDSSVFKTRLPPGGAPIRPSAPFAEVPQGLTGLAEDNFPRAAYNGAGEFFFIRNSRVSDTAYHINVKRVKLDGTDRDPHTQLIDTASQGVLNGAVAANLGTQYLVAWMDGRRAAQQPADQINIYGAFVDGVPDGDQTKPFIQCVARARPIFGNPPLTASFSDEGSTGIVDAFRWDFGDGNSSQFAFATNKYTQKGEYIAVLSLIRTGLYYRDFMRILVATDALGGGGGPPEAVGGTLGPLSDGINPDIVVNVFSAALNFANTGSDSLRLSGFIDPTVLPVSLLDKSGTITVAGKAYNFTLDANNAFYSPAGNTPFTRVLFNRATGGFLLQSNIESLAGIFAALGAIDETTGKQGKDIIVPVSMSFAGLNYSANITATYVAKSGKSGRAEFRLGVLGNTSTGFVRVFSAKANQTGKAGAEAHNFSIIGNMGLPGIEDLVKADGGVWRITLGNYVEDIPVASLSVNGDVVSFTKKQKGRTGLLQFFYNNHTGGFGVLMKNVPASGANPSGMALAASHFTRADMALSFDFGLQGGRKFQASTYVRLARKKLNSRRWQTR